MPLREDWCADDAGKSGVDEGLTADDDVAPIQFRVIGGPMDSINVASPHRDERPLLLPLVTQNLFYFLTQFIRGPVEEFQITSLDEGPCPLP